MIKQIKAKLRELGFRENEIKAYVALTQLGESPASKIAKKVDLPRTTVISVLDKLESENYISTHKYRGKTYYWIESPKVLQQSLENKAKIATDLNELLGELYHSEADFPSAKVYDTKSSIKKFIEKIIINLPRKSVIYTIDTPGAGHYDKIYSEHFRKTLIDLKNKKGISTKSLIPYQTFNTITKKKLKQQSIIIKEMPKEINFKASIWIIKDMVVLFSGQYPFIVAIRHKLITESINSIYDYIWNISEQKI